MHKLRPLANIQKILISTTSHFVGEYESDELLILHAWRDSHVNSTESPLSRNTFVITLETDPIQPKAGFMLPSYSHLGDTICIYLSILYGKRFDNHGMLEEHGLFRFPDVAIFQSLVQPNLPQNSHKPRRDIEIPLNLSEISRIAPLFQSGQDEKFLRFLETAGRFYLQALRNFEERPEAAYLDLITAGEIISNYFNYEKEEILDDEAKKIIQQITEASENGAELAGKIKNRLLQVKCRFLRALDGLLTDPFFAQHKAEENYYKLKKENIKARLKAAYDLRSKYVHTGIPFGRWISDTHGNDAHEIQIGSPNVADKELAKILAKAPTYFGMERIIRYCLLRFIHLNGNGIPIDSRLSNLNL